MTPPGAVLDRPDAPDTTDIPAEPAPSLFLYRIVSPPAEEPIPTRDEVFQAMYDLGVTNDQAATVYDMFKELAERLRILDDDSWSVKAFFAQLDGSLRNIEIGTASTHLVFTRLENDDPRHPALQRIMDDDVLSENGTEAHRLLEQHFLPGSKYRFVHSFVKECIAGIARR